MYVSLYSIETIFNSNTLYGECQLVIKQLKATKWICLLFIPCIGDFNKRVYATLGDGSGNIPGEREAD